jgi:ribosomal protein L40E
VERQYLPPSDTMEIEAFVFVVFVVAIAVIAVLAAGARAGNKSQRLCPSCGASHPAMAKYCSRCGRLL